MPNYRIKAYSVDMPSAVAEPSDMLKLDTERLESARKRKGLTQADAAANAGGMAQSRWNDIESGRRANITIETLGIIAKAVGCKPSWLLREEE